MAVNRMTVTEMMATVRAWLDQRELLEAHAVTQPMVAVLESVASQLMQSQPVNDDALALSGEMALADWAFDRCLRGVLMILEGWGELWPDEAEIAERSVELLFGEDGLAVTQLAYELELDALQRMRARVADDAEVAQFLATAKVATRPLASWLEEAEQYAVQLRELGQQRVAIEAANQPKVRERDARYAFMEAHGTLRRLGKLAGWTSEQSDAFFAPIERFAKHARPAEAPEDDAVG